MKICYYTTSHGLGHSVRACAVGEKLSPGTELHFRTGVPESFFHEELKRPFSWSRAEFDCGCVQTDCVTVDISATVSRYREIAKRNEKIRTDEVAWLKRERFDAVVCDIPSFPLAAAEAAGVPSIALGNFTWHDVYSEYRERSPGLGPLLEQMAGEYAQAGCLIEAAPALPMPYFTCRRMPAGIIGRQGTDVRDAVCRALDIDKKQKTALIYLGTFATGLPWERLAVLTSWTFLTAEPLPGAPANTRVFDRRRFAFRDVASSVDAVVSKLGYCTVTDCMLNGVPLVYVPRDDFAEYPSLEAEVARWGHGHRIAPGEFRNLDWADALEQVAPGKPMPVPDTGASIAANIIETIGCL